MAVRDLHVIPRRSGQIGVTLDQVMPERISWLSVGRVAEGKITMVDGDPGLGKSTLLMDFAARVSTGNPLPDGPVPKRRGVILICAEDDPNDTIRPRAEAMGADLSRILLLHELRDAESQIPGATRLFSLPNDVPLLESLIETGDVGLVIIDPLFAFISQDLKANSDQDVRAALSPLAGVLQRTNAACLLIRHLNKSASANSLYRGGGSVGIIGVARFGLMVAKDPTDPDRRVLAYTKTNLSTPPKSLGFRLQSVPGQDVARIEWLGTVAHTADDLLNDTLLTDDQKAEMDEAGEFLRGMLAKQPQRRETLVQLARKEGISSRSLDKAKKKLGIRHTKLGLHLGPTGAYTVWHLGNTVAADDALYPEPDYTNGKVDDVEGVDDFPYEQATLR